MGLGGITGGVGGSDIGGGGAIWAAADDGGVCTTVSSEREGGGGNPQHGLRYEGRGNTHLEGQEDSCQGDMSWGQSILPLPAQTAHSPF